MCSTLPKCNSVLAIECTSASRWVFFSIHCEASICSTDSMPARPAKSLRTTLPAAPPITAICWNVLRQSSSLSSSLSDTSPCHKHHPVRTTDISVWSSSPSKRNAPTGDPHQPGGRLLCHDVTSSAPCVATAHAAHQCPGQHQGHAAVPCSHTLALPVEDPRGPRRCALHPPRLRRGGEGQVLLQRPPQAQQLRGAGGGPREHPLPRLPVQHRCEGQPGRRRDGRPCSGGVQT